MPSSALEALLRHPAIFRPGEEVGLNHGIQVVPTSHQELDALLPGGGWPKGALIELLPEHTGIGELTLLMGAFHTLSHDGRVVALVAPPYPPYGPALSQYQVDLRHLLLVRTKSAADAQWAAEQCLRSGTCTAVVCWDQGFSDTALRRLHLAAEAGEAIAFLYRSPSAVHRSSPATLRIRLLSAESSLVVELFKCHGRPPRSTRLRGLFG